MDTSNICISSRGSMQLWLGYVGFVTGTEGKAMKWLRFAAESSRLWYSRQVPANILGL